MADSRPLHATGTATLATGVPNDYTFSRVVGRFSVCNLHGSATLLVRINQSTASATAWDFFVPAGTEREFEFPGAKFVSLFQASGGSLTLDTHFTVVATRW